MYIDGDTHYWPLRFLDKVKHPGLILHRLCRLGDVHRRYSERLAQP
jgi:hypothetical protein